MRIAFISEALPYLPSAGGFRLYGANLIRILSQNHAIDLISFVRDDDQQHLDWPRQYCASVNTIPGDRGNLSHRIANVGFAHLWGKPLTGRKQLATLLRSAMGARAWDVLHIEGEYTGGLIPPDLPIAKVLSLHDSWTLRCEEMLQCVRSSREKLYYAFLKQHKRRYERLVLPRFEKCTVVAGRDLQEVRKTAPRADIELIPYGTDTEYFHPLSVQKEPATLVFHSHLGYAPNIEAALEFADEIFPQIRQQIPNAIFHLVGAKPVSEIHELARRPGIRLSPDLPDLRASVCSASIYVCAIRHGTGLKSKMLEAMAMRMPIVAYHPGSTVGIDCAHGQHLLAAENPKEFADHVLNLLRHPELAERLAQAARQLVCEKYSWESRATAYECLYQQAIEKRRNGGRVSARSSQSTFRE